jgi:hypothetical protein
MDGITGGGAAAAGGGGAALDVGVVFFSLSLPNMGASSHFKLD